jgi:hypothetical protein
VGLLSATIARTLADLIVIAKNITSNNCLCIAISIIMSNIYHGPSFHRFYIIIVCVFKKQFMILKINIL